MTDDRPITPNDLPRALGIETWQDARDARDAIAHVRDSIKTNEKVVSGWWQVVAAVVAGAVAVILSQIKWRP